MGTPFSQPQVEESGGRWIPVVIGIVVIVAAIAIVLIFFRPQKATQAPINPYAENLVITDLKLSASENFVGGSISYLDGKVTNTGGKTITAATIECLFRNSMGQVVQTENAPLMILHSQPGYPDLAPLNVLPLQPNQTREFRLTFEHISDDWNHGYPELRFTQLTLK